MWAELRNITPRVHLPVGVAGSPLERAAISSAAERAISTWLAVLTGSCSHQPLRVKVRLTRVGWPVSLSIEKSSVNCAPIRASTPSRSSTSLSQAASSVPSAGRAPVVGVQK